MGVVMKNRLNCSKFDLPDAPRLFHVGPLCCRLLLISSFLFMMTGVGGLLVAADPVFRRTLSFMHWPNATGSWALLAAGVIFIVLSWLLSGRQNTSKYRPDTASTARTEWRNF